MIIDMLTVSMGNSGSVLPADKVSYDNTTSGLEADNVQDAIGELNDANTYDESGTEKVCGLWGEKKLYRKIIPITLPNYSGGQMAEATFQTGISSGTVRRIFGGYYGSGIIQPLPNIFPNSDGTFSIVQLYSTIGVITIKSTSVYHSGRSGYVVLEYTKD